MLRLYKSNSNPRPTLELRGWRHPNPREKTKPRAKRRQAAALQKLRGRAYHDEAALATGKEIALRVANLGDAETVAFAGVLLPAFGENFLVDGDGLAVLDGHFGGDGALAGQFGELAHGFIEDDGDDAAVSEASATGVIGAENEAAAGAVRFEIEFERQLHAGLIGGATTETMVGGLRIEFEYVGHFVFRLDQGHVGAFGATRAALALAHFDAQKFGENGDAASDLLFVEAGKAEAQGIGKRRLHVEIAARSEKDAAFPGVDHEFAGIEAGGQFEPEAHATFGTRPARAFGHEFTKRFVEGLEAIGVDLAHAREMLMEEAAAKKFGERGLGELVGVEIGHLLDQAETFDGGGRRDDPTDAEAGESDLGEAVNVNDEIDLDRAA